MFDRSVLSSTYVINDASIKILTKNKTKHNLEFTDEQLSRIPESIRNSGDNELIRNIIYKQQ